MSAPARFGAFPGGDGRVFFRVWAPNAVSVAVTLVPGTCLAPIGNGIHEGHAPGGPGDDYLYVLDGNGALPDPWSRCQPQGIGGPSRVVDTTSYGIAPGPDLGLGELVVYELHVGAFSEEGTFEGAVPHLEGLADLGVTAIQLMPIGTFPGNRGWGYDVLYPFAPHPAYGGPDAFARLVDEAHRAGLAVILDVVYNHLGPGADAITAYGPYVTGRHTTPWGDAIDYAQPAVRDWAIQNGEQWVHDFRVDGLRVDAAFAITDDGPRHVLAELRERLPGTLLIAEQPVGDTRPIDEWGYDAQTADGFHHELHVALTGERHGNYARHDGRLSSLGAEYARAPAERLVYCSQNHDQVGNRAQGDRPRRDELELRAAALLFAPQTPLLFMGEEYGERSPFQFFTDHPDPAVAEATREGRHRDFGFEGRDVPDPQDPETFARSKLSRDEQPGLRDLYTELLRLRRRLPPDVTAHADDAARIVRIQRGEVELVADFENRTVEITRKCP